MTAPAQVFLSHASKDQRFVSRLADTLTRHQVPVWYSRADILGAQEWHDEIGNALQHSDWFVVVLSRNAVKSMWVKRELLYALRQERFGDRIIPLLYKPCEFEKLSWVLPGFQFVEFQGGFEAGCSDLLRIWNLEYQPDSGRD